MLLENEVIRESFVLHMSFIKTLPKELRAQWLEYIVNYAACGDIPEFSDPIYRENFLRIKERIDADQEVYQKKVKYQKEYYERKRAEKEEEFKGLKTLKTLKSLKTFKDLPIYESEFKSDSEFKSEFKSDTDSEFKSDVCEKRDFFLSLWNKNADVLGIAQAIERPNDFNAYFDNESVTKETIEKGITHFVEAVKSGKLQKRFIPATPDRFILKNTLERFQEPMTDKSKSVIYDADHRGEFQEVEQA